MLTSNFSILNSLREGGSGWIRLCRVNPGIHIQNKKRKAANPLSFFYSVIFAVGLFLVR